MRVARVVAGAVFRIVALLARRLLALEADSSTTLVPFLAALVRVPIGTRTAPDSIRNGTEVYMQPAIRPVTLDSVDDSDGAYWREDRDDDAVDRHGTRLAAGC